MSMTEPNKKTRKTNYVLRVLYMCCLYYSSYTNIIINSCAIMTFANIHNGYTVA